MKLEGVLHLGKTEDTGSLVEKSTLRYNGRPTVGIVPFADLAQTTKMIKKNEDLFAESTMSFGDHLEELRICLWRAIIWLFVGFIGGLFLGNAVVAYIQKPLNNALEKYYLQRADIQVDKDADILKEYGYNPNAIKNRAVRERLIPEVFFIYEDQFDGLGDTRRTVEPSTDEVDAVPRKLIDQVDNLNEFKKPDSRKATKEQETPKELPTSADPEQTRQDLVASGMKPFVLFRKVEDFSGTRSKALGVHEPFSIYIKASLLVGFVIASPGIFYSVWSFVAAGLYLHERKYIYIFMPFSILLFIGGATLAFFFVFGFVLDFLFMFNAMMNIDPDTRISEWINFAFILPIGFGISFQLPLVIFVLERVGIFTVEQLLSKWKVAVLVIFVISMFLTPADPQSLILMATPLCILYFMGIGLCYLVPKKKSEFDY